MGLDRLINRLDSICLMFFNRVEEHLESSELRVNFGPVRIVNHKGHGQTVKTIPVRSFSRLHDALEDLIFLCDAVMVLKMVNKVSFPMFTQEVKLDMG